MDGSGFRTMSYGFVGLDNHEGGDLSVVNGARISFAKHQDQLDAADTGLINFLMRERHGSPFEHNIFRFHIKCPIFVAREWFRHRIGSFNEMSGRYTKLEPHFWVPAVAEVRTQVGKPGAYSYEPLAEDKARLFCDNMREAAHRAWEDYDWALRMGVAREQASRRLGVNIYTQFVWSVNARSLMNFLSLRTAPTAQYEIRKYALDVEDFFAECMPITWQAWLDNGKVAP